MAAQITGLCHSMASEVDPSARIIRRIFLCDDFLADKARVLAKQAMKFTKQDLTGDAQEFVCD
jgi:hypothetical protein